MDHQHKHEHELNPPPHKYKVSRLTKIIFFVFFIFGIAAYFYMIIDRRLSQRRFMLENQMSAVRLAPLPVPELLIKDFTEQKEGSLSNYLGQYSLLNIFATWCLPCQEEMPSLELLHQKIGDKVKIIALSVDEKPEDLDNFLKAHKLSFVVLHDNNLASARLFGVSKYPETFLISPAGILLAQLSGPRDWASPAMINWLLGMIK